MRAIFRDARRGAGERGKRRRSERDNNLRLDRGYFRFDPGTTGAHLSRIRLLVDAPLTPLFKLEVLDGVGHVDLIAIDARSFQGAVQELAGGSDEWRALLVLLITGLF